MSTKTAACLLCTGVLNECSIAVSFDARAKSASPGGSFAGEALPLVGPQVYFPAGFRSRRLNLASVCFGPSGGISWQFVDEAVAVPGSRPRQPLDALSFHLEQGDFLRLFTTAPRLLDKLICCHSSFWAGHSKITTESSSKSNQGYKLSCPFRQV